jgi:hypothetical protein
MSSPEQSQPPDSAGRLDAAAPEFDAGAAGAQTRPAPAGGPAAARAARLTRDPVCTSYG